jgi:DinB superfamily
MSEPTLTATAGGTALLSPLLAQWDTSVEMLLQRLDGLTDEEYRWPPTPGAADLAEDGSGTLRAVDDRSAPTRTIAWTLAHLADMCWTRADYCDGSKSRSLDYGPFPGTALEALDEVRAATARWRSAVTGATAEQALQVGYSSYPQGMDPDLPFVDIVWWMNRELIAHGSDAATVRDLYAARRLG